MTVFDPVAAVDELGRGLEAEADPERAENMARYMKNHFAFFGVQSPVVRTLTKPVLTQAKTATADEVVGFASECWRRDQREFHYAGALMTRKWAGKLGPEHLPDVETLITTKSWWDTVDTLAAHTVGPMVRAHPELAATMDRWIESENLWLARTAILHQLGYKEATDGRRLFRYCSMRAKDREFFIRKAIGWALRQYARVEPDAVRRFVADNEERLSGLSKREALKHLER